MYKTLSLLFFTLSVCDLEGGSLSGNVYYKIELCGMCTALNPPFNCYTVVCSIY